MGLEGLVAPLEEVKIAHVNSAHMSTRCSCERPRITSSGSSACDLHRGGQQTIGAASFTEQDETVGASLRENRRQVTCNQPVRKTEVLPLGSACRLRGALDCCLPKWCAFSVAGVKALG
jgi:hypothetical protein